MASNVSIRSCSRALRAAKFRPATISYVAKRNASTSSQKDLKETLKEVIPAKREQLKQLKAVHGQKVLGEITVENAIGGMRGLKGMLWEGSVLDANEGIRFHGKTIKDCQEVLPKGLSGQEMLPEGMFWLLLTGQVPSTEQVRGLSRTLAENAGIPEFIEKLLDNLPTTLHPMTQFAIAVSALNHDSKFAKLYESGTLKKADYWEPTFDDSIQLLAKLPTIAAKIYQNTYLGGGALPPIDLNQDWSHNYAAMLGKADNEGFVDLLRLYLALHGDHEGGNVSAHATHLVGSALSDPFLSYSAGLQGLAGPLHGLAAQEVLRFVQKMQKKVGNNATSADVEEYLWSLLKSGQVIPGYGHAVLRKPDPRFDALMAFAESRPEVKKSDVFKLVKKTSEVATKVLTEHGKTKNPHPNVDSASGCLFHHYGINHDLYYTVTFGVSRGLGPLAQLVWDRALGLPIERPKSLSMDAIVKAVGK
ncbi:citrate synthase-like protein [Tricharina praecox]|uniref:citrate synthase-like protein n=1 Tax=Tricharina praecox TaxID=43433 RepID=UPI00221FA42E|nr:citrate synthase-like protein [Tricharina praecox]KAI5853904.1 citrate synthase-like protein [Tricharina praecox]